MNPRGASTLLLGLSYPARERLFNCHLGCLLLVWPEERGGCGTPRAKLDRGHEGGVAQPSAVAFEGKPLSYGHEVWSDSVQRTAKVRNPMPCWSGRLYPRTGKSCREGDRAQLTPYLQTPRSSLPPFLGLHVDASASQWVVAVEPRSTAGEDNANTFMSNFLPTPNRDHYFP